MYDVNVKCLMWIKKAVCSDNGFALNKLVLELSDLVNDDCTFSPTKTNAPLLSIMYQFGFSS